MRPIERVLINGWSQADLSLAIAHLRVVDLGAGQSDGQELASELLRWWQSAMVHNAPMLADRVNDCRPAGSYAGPWDRLITDEDFRPALADLLEAYPHAAELICETLDNDLDYRLGDCWDDLSCDHQRYVLALLAIGTPQCLDYLLRHCGVLCGRDIDDVKKIVDERAQALVAAAMRLWPELEWSGRVSVVLTLHDLALPVDEFVDLALAVDPRDLTVKQRVAYVTLLGCVDEAPSRQKRIAEVFREALRGDTQDECTRHLLQESFNYLESEHLTEQEIRLAAMHGVMLLGLEVH